jgi:hypothetical protein
LAFTEKKLPGRMLDDDNIQNRNAANAGDALKHAALLACLETAGSPLRTIVETHAGGGIYRVPADSFCIGLPEESILGRHQRRAALPPADPDCAFYSASGDQILTHLRDGGRYIAFDNNPLTSQRLRLVAAYRGRAEALQTQDDFRGGNGPSLADVLRECDPSSSLVMVDPLDAADMDAAMPMIDEAFLVLVFGAEPYFGWEKRQRFEKAWQTGQKRGRFFETAWCGDGRPDHRSRYAFHLFAFSGRGGVVPDSLFEAMMMEIKRLRECRNAWHFGSQGWTLG